MIDFEQRLRSAKCCHCEKPMKQSRHINLVQLQYLAKWESPAFNNVLFPLPYNLAGSLLCDECVDKKSNPKFAIEFREDDVIYHTLDELEREAVLS